jgi:hypothetical protein
MKDFLEQEGLQKRVLVGHTVDCSTLVLLIGALPTAQHGTCVSARVSFCLRPVQTGFVKFAVGTTTESGANAGSRREKLSGSSHFSVGEQGAM